MSTSTKSAARCPVSRTQFQASAKPVTITVAGMTFEAEAREFSTKSLGWYLSGKVTVEVDGVKVPALVNGVPVVPDRVMVRELASKVPAVIVKTPATVVSPPSVAVWPVGR